MTRDPVTETIEVDLLVIGSGAAGMTAALTAVCIGMHTLVLEKSDYVGGTTAHSEGMIWVPCSQQAKACGVEDSQASAVEYLAGVAGNHLDRERVEAYLYAAPTMLAFVEANSDVAYALASNSIDYYPEKSGATEGARSLVLGKFDGRKLGSDFFRLRSPLKSTAVLGTMFIAGADLPHFYKVAKSPSSALVVAKLVARYVDDRLSGWGRSTLLGNGEGLIAALWHAFSKRGGQLRTSARVTKLVSGDKGIAGAVFVQDGREVRVLARNGVILATGGFSANSELRARFDAKGSIKDSSAGLTAETATGDGMVMAEEIGASINQDLAQPFAWAPASWVPHKGSAFPHFLERAKPGVVIVDGDGRRFANEAMIYHDLVPSIRTAILQTGGAGHVWIIADHKAQRRYGLGAAPPSPATIAAEIRSGYLVKANTISALATKLGVDPLVLAETIERFNCDAISGEDRDFGRGVSKLDRAYGDTSHAPNPCLGPLVTPPFYAVSLRPGDLGSLVGLRTNADACVLDTQGQVIPGLYAAGLDAASALGGYYPAGGVTVGAAMTFGWIAAKSALGRGETTRVAKERQHD
ncbi:MAG: hypothetical protein RL230_496 [Pseudomonadota bacterium]